ncbi:amidase family protein [Candidatus Symbiopectobacterium sp. 'North America']|uniref:amidase family protein n=1 Tax=Candidatus Symbiopectobacterium sp. 'North America' TaxID=2794574 RepID=UPI00245893E0|nr:amidase family protein [Candidatus Symbiopectobacterium sp. 'North America']
MPKTGNAWNPAHTPGGSSSGSAAAVGARMALVDLGMLYQQITDWHACLPPLCQA